MRFARGLRSIDSVVLRKYNVERPAAEMAAYLAQGPGLSELPLDDVRKSIEGAKAGVPIPDVDEAWITVPADVGGLPMVRDAVAANQKAGVPTSVFSDLRGNPTLKNLDDGLAAYKRRP